MQSFLRSRPLKFIVQVFRTPDPYSLMASYVSLFIHIRKALLKSLDRVQYSNCEQRHRAKLLLGFSLQIKQSEKTRPVFIYLYFKLGALQARKQNTTVIIKSGSVFCRFVQFFCFFVFFCSSCFNDF